MCISWPSCCFYQQAQYVHSVGLQNPLVAASSIPFLTELCVILALRVILPHLWSFPLKKIKIITMMLISLLCSPQLSESQDIAGAQEVKTSEEKQEIEAPPAPEEESCL